MGDVTESNTILVAVAAATTTDVVWSVAPVAEAVNVTERPPQADKDL